MMFICFYYFCINIITFILYGIDKRRAVLHNWRISELSLLMFSLLGGSMGALIGMQFFRHKTRHIKFLVLNPLFLAGNVILAIYIFMVLK